MADRTIKNFIIWSMILYFGWLLSLPFYGPVFSKVISIENLDGISLITTFIICHTITYLMAGVSLKDKSRWHSIMIISLLITIAFNCILLISSQWIWMVGMAVMGVSSAFYVLGWSVIYALSGQVADRIKIMSLVIIGTNLLLLIFTFLASLFPTKIILVLINIPLILNAMMMLKASKAFRGKLIKPYVQVPLSKPLVLIFSLFIFAIYLNGGFMYRIMLPALSVSEMFGTYYPFIIYITALIVIYKANRQVNRTLIIYLGVSFLGLAFIAFALLGEFHSGYIMTIGLMESSFAFIDLFLWTTLSSLALIYGEPYKIFGIILAANTSSILFGDFIGIQLLNANENTNFIIALLSASSILLAIIVIPWLIKSIEQKTALVMKNECEVEGHFKMSPFQVLMQYLLPNQKLTQREEEVVKLTLQGMTNKDIAQELFISEHTVKTHLKNIFGKYGVTRKKELMHLATRKEKNSI